MPTIRDLVDGRDLNFAGAPAPDVAPAKGASKGKGKGSPLAQHVATHMQDPIGATKPIFDDLSKKRLDYDQAREGARRALAPVQSVINHVNQMHGLQPEVVGLTPPGVTPPPGMIPPGGVIDDMENDPNSQFPGSQNPQDPQNMNQSAGTLNQNRPSLTGHEPGAAPKQDKQVVPTKLGLASPGSPTAQNSPAPRGSNPQSMQYNPAARPPKGNRQLPGAKGPGDAKVANRTKKAQSNSPGLKNSVSRPIKVTVHANKSYPETTTIEASRSMSDLMFHGSIKAAGSMPIGPGGAMGPSGVMPGANPATGAPMKSSGKKKMKALDELSDKATGTQNQVAYNPTTGPAQSKLEANKTIDMCGKCGKMHTADMACGGHSRGAKKGWSTRGKGHLSPGEKASHYSTMDARDVSTKERKSLSKKGEAMPGGRFPIANTSDLANAKRAIGRSKNPAATRRFINKRAKQLGAKPIGQTA